MATPPGWPTDLPPPDADGFAERVVAWLLDRGPGEWRLHDVLRRHPRALAHLVGDHLAATRDGLRASYATARADLHDVVPAADMPALLAAIEAEGALVAESLREVGLVAQALAGRQWRERL